MGIAVAGLIVAAGWAIAAGSTAGREELVSVPEDPYLFGVQGSRSSTACDLSGSGRHVVFESAAQQLVERDHNGRTDVFVRDRTDGTVERINRYVDGTENPSGATAASISTNGRYVALLSLDALHDPALPTQAARQAYRIDRDTGEILLASRTTSGAPSPSDVYSPTISGNGRYVAFASSGTQFGAPTNGLQQVFRWDAQTDTIELVSADAAGSAGVSTSNAPSMSNNGRYVAFTSVAGNLVPGDTNGLTDVFVKDMVTGDILRASVDSAGNPATASSSSAPAIAGNGSAVAFQSADPGLVAGDGNGVTDVFVHVLANGETLRASVDGAGAELAEGGYGGSLSSDAQIVLFHSEDAAVAGAGGMAQVFRRDLATGALQALTDAQGADAARARLSGNGDSACFDSLAANLVAADTNGYGDVFVADLDALPDLDRASLAADPWPLSSGNEPSVHPHLDADARHVVFASAAVLDSETFAQAGGRTRVQIYVADRSGGALRRVSSNTGGAPANGDSVYPRISADGRYVVYESEADDIAAGDANQVPDVFRHDLDTGETVRISLNGGYAGIGAWRPSISDDGSRIAFVSDGDGYVPGDGNDASDVFVWDASTGLVRVNLGPLDVEASGGDAYLAEISGDGRHVAFESRAPNMVDGDANNAIDVFVRDLEAGVTERISVSATGDEGEADSEAPSISRNGRFVAFTSAANNLVPGDVVRASDIFLVDRETGTISRITDAMDGGAASDLDVVLPRVSPDGSRVVFVAWRRPSGPFWPIVYDVGSGQMTARLPATTGATLPQTLATNEDGSAIALDWLPPLVATDTNQLSDAYLLLEDDGDDSIFRNGFDGTPP